MVKINSERLICDTKGFRKITQANLLERINHRDQINDLVTRGALFVVNHSGGKDSQAMFALVASIVPADQLLVVHAHLGRVEWPGVREHIKANIGSLPYVEALARNRAGENKSFLDMVLGRGMWPSPSNRQCTSDLKRGPIEREIRGYLKANPQYEGLIVNCMGLRAQESSKRAKAVTFRLNEGNSKAGREWYDWLPIHDMTISETHLEGEVYDTIRLAGQKPHWAYLEGMKRLSCRFCIMACQADLSLSARLNPGLFAEMVATERFIDHTFLMPTKKHGLRTLEEVTGVPADPILVEGHLARLAAL